MPLGRLDRPVRTPGLERTLVSTSPVSSTSDKVVATPPRRPTSADIELLAFAQSAELSARDLYEQAVAAGAGGDQVASLVALGAHHDAYAQSLSALLGTDAPRERNDVLFSALTTGFGPDTESMALAAHGLENTLVVTHTDLLGLLEGTEGAALVASILIGESRHCAAMAALAGKSPVSDIDLFLKTSEVDSLAPQA